MDSQGLHLSTALLPEFSMYTLCTSLCAGLWSVSMCIDKIVFYQWLALIVNSLFKSCAASGRGATLRGRAFIHSSSDHGAADTVHSDTRTWVLYGAFVCKPGE